MATFTLILATIVTALASGLFYAYSCSVIPGLGKLDDANYLSAMQSINRAILNPVFFFSFMGAVLLLPLSAALHYGTERFGLVLAAAVVYAIGVFGVTVAGNVPLNNALDAIDLKSADAFQLAAAREMFEAKWNSLNHWRTVANIVALVLVVWALIKRN